MAIHNYRLLDAIHVVTNIALGRAMKCWELFCRTRANESWVLQRGVNRFMHHQLCESLSSWRLAAQLMHDQSLLFASQHQQFGTLRIAMTAWRKWAVGVLPAETLNQVAQHGN